MKIPEDKVTISDNIILRKMEDSEIPYFESYLLKSSRHQISFGINDFRMKHVLYGLLSRYGAVVESTFNVPCWGNIIVEDNRVLGSSPVVSPSIIASNIMIKTAEGFKPHNNLGIAIKLFTGAPVDILASFLELPTPFKPINIIYLNRKYLLKISKENKINEKIACITEENISDISKVYVWLTSLEKIGDAEGKKRLTRALNRYLESTYRGDSEVKIIDLAIAYETLVGYKIEGSHNYACRAAGLIHDDTKSKEFNNTLNKCKKFYKVRSKIVHGDEVDKNELEKTIEDGDKIIRKVILGFLRRMIDLNKGYKDVINELNIKLKQLYKFYRNIPVSEEIYEKLERLRKRKGIKSFDELLREMLLKYCSSA